MRCDVKRVLVAMGLMGLPIAHAEGPMNTDDAGTLGKGGMKLEGVGSRDDDQRGGELLFGFSLLENLEFEIGASGARDAGTRPDTRLRGVGFGAKWVPYQNERGWSLGIRFDYGRTRITGGAAPEPHTEHGLFGRRPGFLPV